MKKKMKKRIRGSISIFLVIIMVPMMCLSGLIVDGSRVELAKASISSAGDLTMNSALANYDTVLKDVYGLFAMSQSAEDLEKNLYSYFVDTLMANGIITSESEVQSNPLLQDIAGTFSGQTSNMLSMELTEDDFTATKLADSSLANPYILKNQIVEYQKYRAPISSALSLLDGIASLKKILNQSSVNKAKTNVDEKSGELNKKSDDLYDVLKEYSKKTDSYNSQYDTFTYKGNTYTYKQAYEDYIIPAYVNYLAESMPYGVKMEKDSKTNVYTFRFSDEHLEVTTGKDNTAWYGYTEKTTEQLREELIFAYKQFETDIIQDATSELILVTDINNLDLEGKQSYATAYKMYMQKVYNLKNFYDAYKKQYDTGSDDITFITEHETDIIDIFENAVKFSTVLENYKKTSTTAQNNASGMLTALNSDINAKIDCVSDNNKLLEEAVKAIEKVETSIVEVDKANEKLKGQIDGYNGSDDPDAFSKQMQDDYEYYETNIDPAKVTALKTKLDGLKTYFDDVEKYLKSVTFAGLAASDKDSNTLGNLVEMTKKKNTTTGVKNIDYINAHIADGINELTTFYKTQYSEGSKPDVQSVSIKEDAFYKYLEQSFSVVGTDEDKEVEQQMEDLKKAVKDDKEDETDSDAKSVEITEEMKSLLPSQGEFIPPEAVKGYDGKENFSSLFDRISTAVEELLAGIEQAAKAGRDNLYVTQYVFDMFSYDTREAEYKVSKDADVSKKLSELDLTMKTSSGVELSASNNYMYGSEVEYILYGGFEPEANVKKAKTYIFCIRFLANASFAFTNSEIRNITLTPALSVQAATMGVVPYKLAQVVFQLCLALGESSNDIKLMEQGQKVALIKSSDTWSLSLEGGVKMVKEKISQGVTDFVTEKAESAKGVVSDLIDAGAEKIEVKVEDYISDMSIAVNQEMEELIGQMFSAFEEEVICSLDGYLKQGKNAVGNAGTVAQNIINSADQKVTEIINSSNATVRPILQSVYDMTLKEKLFDCKGEIEGVLASIDQESAGDILIKVQKSISNKLSELINSASAYVSSQTSNIVSNLRSKLTITDGYIDMASDKVLDVTNEFLDSTFDSVSEKLPDMGGKTSNNASLASILKFNYGDYLKIFVFLKLCVNDEEILSRIADVIQLNVNNALSDSRYTHPKKGNFLMEKAYTYIQIEADVKLKTMFISLPFFTEYSGKSGSHFKVKYKSVLGY